MLSVSQLSRLLEQGEYKLCLEEAATLLAEGEPGPEALARISGAICRSQYELVNYGAAAKTGVEAVRLAAEANMPDLRGQALADLGSALLRLRRYDEALDAFQQFCDGLPGYTGARCLEGIVLERMGEALARTGRADAALQRYQAASRWNESYGDEREQVECSRAMLRIYLDRGELTPAGTLLEQEQLYAEAHQFDREFRCAYLLDQALVLYAAGRHEQSVLAAFRALDFADDRLSQQSRAHLLLCQNALAQNKPVEALSFALAARVAAVDGKLYELEFEASEITFRLLRERGERVFRELEADLADKNVDVFQYMSAETINRMFRQS